MPRHILTISKDDDSTTFPKQPVPMLDNPHDKSVFFAQIYSLVF